MDIVRLAILVLLIVFAGYTHRQNKRDYQRIEDMIEQAKAIQDVAVRSGLRAFKHEAEARAIRDDLADHYRREREASAKHDEETEAHVPGA